LHFLHDDVTCFWAQNDRQTSNYKFLEESRSKNEPRPGQFRVPARKQAKNAYFAIFVQVFVLFAENERLQSNLRIISDILSTRTALKTQTAACLGGGQVFQGFRAP